MSIINLIIFLSILLFVIFSSSYLAGLILIFALSILEIAEYGMTHFLFLLVCELTIALFIVREIKFKKDNSPLLKYNPKIIYCREKFRSFSVLFSWLPLWYGLPHYFLLANRIVAVN